MPVVGPPASSTAGPWDYGDVNDIIRECGAVNAGVYSDPDATNDPSTLTAYLQAAGDYGQMFINNALTNYNFVTPATASLDVLRFVFAKASAYQLYQVRGTVDKGTKGGNFSNAFAEKLAWADSQMRELTFLNRGGFTHTPGYSDAPTSVGRNGVQPSTGLGCYGGFGGWPWRWGW